MTEFVLQKNVRLEPAELDLLPTVELQTMHVYDKLCVVVLSTDSGKIRVSNKIMLMSELKDLNIQHDIYFQCGIIDNT
jgi:molybdopterin biosynthesis enzyme